ncbi:MAG TPA: DUF998 domain-containing protein [Acidisarcina sp.]
MNGTSRNPIARLRARAGAVLWLLCFQFFLAEQVARLGWKQAYSMRHDYISDLGAVHCVLPPGAGVCSPLHAVMNASFILQGCLIIFGALLVRPQFRRGALMTSAFVILAVSGLGVLAVGLFPEDVSPGVHSLMAAIHLLCGNYGLLSLSKGLESPAVGEQGLQPRLTLIAGSIGLVATLLLIRGQDFGLGIGLIERLAAYPLTLWLGSMGAFLLMRRARRTNDL